MTAASAVALLPATNPEDDEPELSPTAWRVLRLLVQMLDHQEFRRVRRSDIASANGMKPRTVRIAIQELVTWGFVEMIPQPRGNNTPAAYRITPAALDFLFPPAKTMSRWRVAIRDAVTDRSLTVHAICVAALLSQLLDSLEYRPVKPSAVADILPMTTKSAQRALRLLVERGYIEESDGMYRLYTSRRIGVVVEERETAGELVRRVMAGRGA